MKIAIRLMLLLALGLGACGDESPIGVNNVSPAGSVGGLVVDAATMKPLAGVQVQIIAGARLLPDAPGQTDANGRFAVDGVPAGEILVRLQGPEGKYHDVTIEAILPNAAGDFPLANAILSLGPIGLLPLAPAETAFRLQLVHPDGAPAAGVKAHLRTLVGWVDLGAGSPAGLGSAFVEATSDNVGVVRFGGMPDLVRVAGMIGVGSSSVSDVVRVIIPPFDANKDGVLDFYGKEQTFSLLKLGGAVPTIVLSSAPTGALQVVASNIAAMMGKPSGNRVLATSTGPLFVTFNWPILDKATEITVHDERGLLPTPAVTAKRSLSANLLTVNFEGLQEGNEYNVNIRTRANVENSLVEGSFGAPVFTPIKSGKVALTPPLTRDKANPGRLRVTFSEPIGTGIPNQSLSGAYAVLFFDYDLNGSGSKGDAAGERGYSTSTIPMYIDEVSPPGAAGRSGLSRYWFFDLPIDASGTTVPPGTLFELGFSQIGAGTVQRADGSAVSDIGSLVVPAL